MRTISGSGLDSDKNFDAIIGIPPQYARSGKWITFNQNKQFQTDVEVTSAQIYTIHARQLAFNALKITKRSINSVMTGE